MINYLKYFLANILNTRLFWFCVFLISLIFEFCGYYFQYIDHLAPCELCVYERTAFACIMLVGLFVIINPKILKYLGLPIWGYAAYMGLSVAIEHVDAETNIFAQCNSVIAANRFWIPLDQYFPWFFKPTGGCGDIPWSFMNHSMPWWVRVIFAGYIIAIVVSVLLHLGFAIKKHIKKKNFSSKN